MTLNCFNISRSPHNLLHCHSITHHLSLKVLPTVSSLYSLDTPTWWVWFNFIAGYITGIWSLPEHHTHSLACQQTHYGAVSPSFDSLHGLRSLLLMQAMPEHHTHSLACQQTGYRAVSPPPDSLHGLRSLLLMQAMPDVTHDPILRVSFVLWRWSLLKSKWAHSSLWEPLISNFVTNFQCSGI